MAVMDSMSVWTAAFGSRDMGLAWRDAVAGPMRESAAYVSNEQLVVAEADRLRQPADAAARLFEKSEEMRPWPDSAALLASGCRSAS